MASYSVESVDNAAGAPVTSVVTGVAPDPPVRDRILFGSLAIVAAASGVAWLLWTSADPQDFAPRSDYTAVAALILFATALERVMEPISKYLLPDDKQDASAEVAKVAAEVAAKDPTIPSATVQVAATAAAAAVADLKATKSERAVLHWAIATTLGFVGPSLLGIFFLRVVSAEGSAPNRYLDMLLTALIVGAGTKPVHDAIASIQAKKEAAQEEG